MSLILANSFLFERDQGTNAHSFGAIREVFNEEVGRIDVSLLSKVMRGLGLYLSLEVIRHADHNHSLLKE